VATPSTSTPRSESKSSVEGEQLLFQVDDIEETHEQRPSVVKPVLQRSSSFNSEAKYVQELIAEYKASGQDLSLQAIAEELDNSGFSVILRSTSPPSFSRDNTAALRTLRHQFLVVRSPVRPRDEIVVDLRFRDLFELPGIARSGYTAMLQDVPVVYVGEASALRSMVQQLAGFMAVEYAAKDWPVAPWRSADALLSRWFARSTTDLVVRGSGSSRASSFGSSSLLTPSVHSPASSVGSSSTRSSLLTAFFSTSSSTAAASLQANTPSKVVVGFAMPEAVPAAPAAPAPVEAPAVPEEEEVAGEAPAVPVAAVATMQAPAAPATLASVALAPVHVSAAPVLGEQLVQDAARVAARAPAVQGSAPSREREPLQHRFSFAISPPNDSAEMPKLLRSQGSAEAGGRVQASLLGVAFAPIAAAAAAAAVSGDAAKPGKTPVAAADGGVARVACPPAIVKQLAKGSAGPTVMSPHALAGLRALQIAHGKWWGCRGSLVKSLLNADAVACSQ